MTGPTSFLVIIGAPKSGTTTLAKLLDRHPDIVLGSEKEPRYFTDFASIEWKGPGTEKFRQTMISDESAYLASFARPEKPDASWGVDASTDYLWCEAAPERICEWSKRYQTKLICILRDPVDRALSEYQHTLRDGLEELDLLTAIEREPDRIRDHWHPLFYHIRRSCYSKPLGQYRELFGDDLLALGFDELRDPVRCLKRVTSFLGIDEFESVSDVHLNASYVYRYATAARFMTSKSVRSIARQFVPSTLRSRIRKLILPAITKSYSPSEVGLARLDEELATEIRACWADQSIPTDGWNSINRLSHVTRDEKVTR